MILKNVLLTASNGIDDSITVRANVTIEANDPRRLANAVKNGVNQFSFTIEPEPETFNTGDEVHWFETTTEKEIYGGDVATDTRQRKGRVLLVDRELGLAAVTHRFPTDEGKVVVFLDVSRLKKGWQ